MIKKVEKYEQKYIEDEEFSLENWQIESGVQYEFYNCIFKDLSLVKANFNDFIFEQCQFRNCDLSMIKLLNTSFREVSFKSCKLLGVHFDICNKFALDMAFDSSLLNDSIFVNLSFSALSFKECSLREVDFSRCELKSIKFDKCDLSGAIFDNSNLEKADFRTAYNYNIDPEKNKLKSAKFSLEGIAGLLSKYQIEIE